MSIRFEHIRCPLHRYTFSVKPIREWVERTCSGRVLNLFAGMTRLAVDEYRNDLDPDMPAHSHLDALDFLRGYQGEKFATILLDPPYAYRKSMERYKGIVCSPFRQLKDEVVKHLTPAASWSPSAITPSLWAKTVASGWNKWPFSPTAARSTTPSPARNALAHRNPVLFFPLASRGFPKRPGESSGRQR